MPVCRSYESIFFGLLYYVLWTSRPNCILGKMNTKTLRFINDKNDQKYLWEVRWMKMVKFTNVELDNKKTNNEPLLQLIASSFLLCVYSTDTVCHRTENMCKKYHNFMVIIDVLKDNTSFWKLIFPPLTFSTNPSFLVFPHPTPSLISWLDTCLGVTSSIYW